MSTMTPDNPVGDTEIDLRSVFQVLVRRRWVALGAFVAIVVLGVVVTMRTPRIYRATATVVIEPSAPDVLSEMSDVYNTGNVGFWSSREYYETQYNVVRSRPVLDKVVAQLGIQPSVLAEALSAADPASVRQQLAQDPLSGLPETVKHGLGLYGLDGLRTRAQMIELLANVDAAAHLRNKLIIKPIKESRLLEISAEDTSPIRAAILANAVAEAYIKNNLDQKVETTRAAVDWLTDQVDNLKRKLEASEIALYDFKKQHNIVSVSLEDRQTMSAETLSQLNESLSETRAQRLALDSRRDLIVRMKKGEVPPEALSEVIANQLIQGLKVSESDLQQERSDLLTRYTADHPRVIAVDEKLRRVQENLAREINHIIDALDREAHTFGETEARLRAAIDEVKGEALELNKKEIDYNRLKRERDNNLALYDLVLKRQKESELQQMLRVNNVSKLEPAIAPDSPVRPRVQMNIVLAVLVGLILGALLAFFVDYLDNTVKTQEQVEKLLKLPVLGIVPAIPVERGQTVGPEVRDLYSISHPRSSVAECCRAIRTNLMFMSPENPARALLVTSSGPREGKSTSVVNLAITMAQSGARTVIVDTDMRRPRLHKSFGLSNDIGISSVVVGEASLDDALRATHQPGLDVLTCGPIPPNPAELLHTSRFKSIAAELAKRYDRVIFDSPPVSVVTDALVLASMVDGVVLIIQVARTTSPAAVNAKRRLDDVGARIYGVVLNAVDLERGGYGSYRDYYQYYRAGYDERGVPLKA